MFHASLPEARSPQTRVKEIMRTDVALLKGGTVHQVAALTGASVGTTAAIRKELAAAGAL